MSRTCSTCGAVESAVDFPKDPKRKQCLHCRNKTRRENYDKRKVELRAVRRDRYHSDPELRARRIKSAVDSAKKNPEARRRNRRNYRAAHREELALESRIYKVENRDKVNASERERYRRRNAFRALAAIGEINNVH